MVHEATLNNDINLIERENGYWDYQFDKGDLVISKDKQSLRNGLIIACLTSWNYLNRQGNPTYSEFGNKAYRELKKKKSNMVEYTIKQYFIEVLNNIRRVHRIVDIQVINHPTDPNAYNVFFTVEATNDEIVKGSFPINNETGLTTTLLEVAQDSDVSTPTTPVTYTVKINNEYNQPITDELIQAYVVKEDGTEEYYHSYKTNDDGIAVIPIYPQNNFQKTTVKFKYYGNTIFAPTTSNNYTHRNKPFYFIVNKDSNLIMIQNKGMTGLKSWIGEIVESADRMEYDTNQPLKTYLVPYGDDYKKYTATDGTYTEESETAYHLINKPSDLQVGDIRLFVENTNNEITIVEDHLILEEDDHLYYRL